MIKTFLLIMVLAVSLLSSGCAGWTKVANVSDLDFYADDKAAESNYYPIYSKKDEKKLAKQIALKLREDLPENGFNYARSEHEVVLTTSVLYFGKNEEKAVALRRTAVAKTTDWVKVGGLTAGVLAKSVPIIGASVYTAAKAFEFGMGLFTQGDGVYYQATTFDVRQKSKKDGEIYFSTIYHVGKVDAESKDDAKSSLRTQSVDYMINFLKGTEGPIGGYVPEEQIVAEETREQISSTN